MCVGTLMTHIEHWEELKAVQQASLLHSLSCNLQRYVSFHCGEAFPWLLMHAVLCGKWESCVGLEQLHPRAQSCYSTLTHTQSAFQRASWYSVAYTDNISWVPTANWSETMWRKIHVQHKTAIYFVYCIFSKSLGGNQLTSHIKVSVVIMWKEEYTILFCLQRYHFSLKGTYIFNRKSVVKTGGSNKTYYQVALWELNHQGFFLALAIPGV